MLYFSINSTLDDSTLSFYGKYNIDIFYYLINFLLGFNRKF